MHRQRSCDSNALLLPAGQLIWKRVGLSCQTDAVQTVAGNALGFARGNRSTRSGAIVTLRST
jgi:hypothetical protein